MAFLYALIPFVIALILRIKFPKTALWIAIIPTIFGVLLLLTGLFFTRNFFGGFNQVLMYASYIVPCSLPALYCVAFYNKGMKIWFAMIPPAIYFIYWFIQYCIMMGFTTTVSALFAGIPGDQSIMITFMCIVFEIWALFCVLITLFVSKLTAKRKSINI